jgi:hypothetical protein
MKRSEREMEFIEYEILENKRERDRYTKMREDLRKI